MGREGEKFRVLLPEFSSVQTEQLSSARGWPRSRVSIVSADQKPHGGLNTVHAVCFVFHNVCIFDNVYLYTREHLPLEILTQHLGSPAGTGIS